MAPHNGEYKETLQGGEDTRDLLEASDDLEDDRIELGRRKMISRLGVTTILAVCGMVAWHALGRSGNSITHHVKRDAHVTTLVDKTPDVHVYKASDCRQLSCGEVCGEVLKSSDPCIAAALAQNKEVSEQNYLSPREVNMVWRLIARQDVSANDGGAFPSSAKKSFMSDAGDNHSSHYMDLDGIPWENFKDEAGRYEFKLEWTTWPDEKSLLQNQGGIVQWTQTSKPTAAFITGYSEILNGMHPDTDPCINFQGLAKSVSPKCVLDNRGINPCISKATNCIGQIGDRVQNIIGPQGIPMMTMELYAKRVPKAFGFKSIVTIQDSVKVVH